MSQSLQLTSMSHHRPLDLYVQFMLHNYFSMFDIYTWCDVYYQCFLSDSLAKGWFMMNFAKLISCIWQCFTSGELIGPRLAFCNVSHCFFGIARYCHHCPWRVEGWVDVGAWLHTRMAYTPTDGHPSNWARRTLKVTVFIETNVLPLHYVSVLCIMWQRVW